MVEQLTEQLRAVQQEQEFLGLRHQHHVRLNRNTNWRVTGWALFEAALALSVTYAQVRYLKRFFEVRSVI